MSETKFDPKKFAQMKLNTASQLKKILKPEATAKPGDKATPSIKAAPVATTQTNYQQDKKATANNEPSADKKGKRSFVLEIVTTTAIAFAISILIHIFIVQIVYIPSSSMEPTFRSHDRVIINKLSYSWIGNMKPYRGELVAVKTPDGQLNIKRVIGLPGESIKISKGHLYINGKRIKERYGILEGKIDYPQEMILKGYYFVLGDNRDRSVDSRTWGAIKKWNIVGSVFMRIWPIGKIRTFN